MTNNGQTLLRELGEAYVTAGYPERAGWYVTPQDQPGAVAFRELSAHGYVEPFCGGWRLTSSGLHAVMSANPMTDGAKGTLRAIREAYIQAGYPAREGWYVERTDAATLPHFLELQSRGFVEAFGTGHKMWFLSDGGLRAILKDGAA